MSAEYQRLREAAREVDRQISELNQTGFDELYDLVEDPFELNDEISNPAMAQPLVQRKSELDRLLIESGAR